MRATDAASNLSPYSNTGTTATQADTQPPTMPGTLTASAAGTTQINLSWGAATDNVGVTGYLVERCQGAGCTTFAQIATPTGTTYNDTGLTSGTTYNYRVRATDAAGNLSPYSNTAPATTPVTVSGLVAAYAFDEGTGTTVADSSGNNYTGTITAATWTTSAKFGKALSFNGSSSWVAIPATTSLNLTTGMTLEAWVNPTTVNGNWRDVIYKGNDNYYLSATSATTGTPAGGGTFGGSGTTAFGTAVLATNTWAHLAVTYDGANLRLYVNGTQISSVARTGNILISNNALQIGGDPFYGQYFAGIIDEVRVYNTALSAAQIQTDMNTPIGNVGPLPQVTLSTTNIGFGSQATGTPSSPQPVTLTNTGTAQLNITGMSFTGLNSGDFAQTNDCGTSVAPNATCTINVTFAPATTGSRSASLSIVDNAPSTPQTVALSGTGTGFSISPQVTTLTFTRTQQFTANSGSSLIWQVDGITGGSSAVGTISTTGLYAPPTTAGTHTVTVSLSDLSQSSNATVYISNYPGTFTRDVDNSRTGLNPSETVLTPANVNVSQFGKLLSYPIDGIADASPLYVANLNIPGKGFHNVVYVATEHDSVYAFDADALQATPLWEVSFINPANGITTVPTADTSAECCAAVVAPEIGITGSPVIDPATNTLYVVAKTKEVSGGTKNYFHRLHALDITTGAEKFGGPVVIQASVPGTGSGASGGRLPLISQHANQRAALLLSNGVVYVAFAGHADQNPYHGWVVGYNAGTLQQTMVFCTSPNSDPGQPAFTTGNGAGIWQSGDGLATDSTGNIFFVTGNGTFDVNTGGLDYGDSFLKISPAGAVVDYFTPHDQQNMSASDLDLGSGGTILLPDQPGTHPHEAITAGKNGTIYLVDRDNMGHYNASNDNQIIQSVVNIFPHGTNGTGNFKAPLHWNGNLYFTADADYLKVFSLTNGRMSTTPTSHSPNIFNYPGSTLGMSSNGATSGILWAIERVDLDADGGGTVGPGSLHAYDATNLANELYNSNQASGSRDLLDQTCKWSAPLVANGKVYVASETQLTIFGLLP